MDRSAPGRLAQVVVEELRREIYSIAAGQGQGPKRPPGHDPVGDPLKLALDAALKQKRSSVTILTNSRGLPWTEDGFRTSWGKAFAKTGLGDLHFDDLRGTAVTRLALVGKLNAVYG